MTDPVWLKTLERKYGRFSIPYLPIVFTFIPAFGMLVSALNAAKLDDLVLYPDAVLAGQLWRLVAFLAVPDSILNTSSAFSILFAVIYLWFVYFVLNSLESRWGAFKLTVYMLLSWFLMVVYSFLFSVPVYGMSEIQMSLFIAMAILFPEFEILLYFVIPVKMKWLGLLTGLFVLYQLFTAPLLIKIRLLMVYAAFFLFFAGPFLGMLQQKKRSRDFRNRD